MRISLSTQLAVVASTLWIATSSNVAGSGSPTQQVWSHESEDIRFAARILESADNSGDPLNNDDNMVQGADAGDIADPSQQQAIDTGSKTPVMRGGGDIQSAEADDEDPGKDLSKDDQEVK